MWFTEKYPWTFFPQVRNIFTPTKLYPLFRNPIVSKSGAEFIFCGGGGVVPGPHGLSACVELGAALRVCMQIQILYLNPHSWEHFGCVRTNLEVFINKVEIFSYFGLPKSVKHILEDT